MHEAFDDHHIERVLESRFPGSDPMDVEDFMSSLQSFARVAAPIAQSALGGAVQGAMMGGPVGAVLGAAGGGVSAALSGSQRPAAPPAQVVQAQAPPPPPQLQTAAVADPNVAQLLMLLSRPETVQALLRMLALPDVSQQVRVGSRQVPAPAFANAMAELAGMAAEASDTPPSTEGSYLIDSTGAPRCDAFNPMDRATLLLSDLVNAELDGEDAGDSDEELENIEVEAFDPMDAYEAARDGRPFDD